MGAALLDVAAIRLSEMMRNYASHRKAFLFSILQITFALSVARSPAGSGIAPNVEADFAVMVTT